MHLHAALPSYIAFYIMCQRRVTISPIHIRYILMFFFAIAAILSR